MAAYRIVNDNKIGVESMEMILEFIKDYQFIILLAVMVLVIIFIFMETLNRVQINRIEKRYKKMMKGAHGKSIEEMVLEHTKIVEDSLQSIEEVKNVYDEVQSKVNTCIQKYAVVRYRAFDDVGSDLSYSIAFLDDKNNGVVLTGIYGRNESTTFAKPIENGISKYDLSDEEKQAVKNAINSR